MTEERKKALETAKTVVRTQAWCFVEPSGAGKEFASVCNAIIAAEGELSTLREALKQAQRIQVMWEEKSARPAQWLNDMDSELFDALDHLDICEALAPADPTQPAKPEAREWRAQHKQFPGIVVKMSKSCDWQPSINPDYQLQHSDDGGKTWVDAE